LGHHQLMSSMGTEQKTSLFLFLKSSFHDWWNSNTTSNMLAATSTTILVTSQWLSQQLYLGYASCGYASGYANGYAHMAKLGAIHDNAHGYVYSYADDYAP